MTEKRRGRGRKVGLRERAKMFQMFLDGESKRQISRVTNRCIATVQKVAKDDLWTEKVEEQFALVSEQLSENTADWTADEIQKLGNMNRLLDRAAPTVAPKTLEGVVHARVQSCRQSAALRGVEQQAPTIQIVLAQVHGPSEEEIRTVEALRVRNVALPAPTESLPET